MSDWPATSPDGLAELNKICRTHRVLPIPAFTRSLSLSRDICATPSPLDWALVKPDRYVHQLVGATTLVTFHIVHYAMKDADIWHLVPHSIRLMNGRSEDAFGAYSSPLMKKNANIFFGGPSPSPSRSPSPILSPSIKKRTREAAESSSSSPKKKKKKN